MTPLGVMQDVVCAAPAYLERRSRPRHPDDLKDHLCLIYLNPDRISRWTFHRGRRVYVVEVDGPLACNYHTALLEPLLAGAGIAKLPEYFVADELARGTLVRLLADYPSHAIPIYAVHHSHNNQPPRVREFLRFAWERLVASARPAATER